MVRFELRRRLATLIRVLPRIGQSDNARALERRVHDLTVVPWVASSDYGREVWAEIAGGLEVAAQLVPQGSELGHDVRMALHAQGEANVLIDEDVTAAARARAAVRLPAPGRLPVLRLAGDEPPRAA